MSQPMPVTTVRMVSNTAKSKWTSDIFSPCSFDPDSVVRLPPPT
jgi:hypothetical protein